MFSCMEVLLPEFARRPVEPDKTLKRASDIAPQTTPELIGHILERYHETHRREFPEAIRLARRVEAVHGAHPDCPRGLGDHLAFMADDLEAHQQKEEQVLFPLLLRGGGPLVVFPIRKMTSEHRDVDEQLAVLAALTHDFTAPTDGCGSWRELYTACRKIDADLREHMRLEEQVLFARFLD
jgi:regulator of cell morphogenesis and NO signaling